MEEKRYQDSVFTKKNLLKLFIILLSYAAVWIVVNQNLLLRQYRGVLVLMAVNIILAVSLNLVTGFLGELSLGHAGFMMIGAYVGALFTNYFSAAFPDIPGIFVILLALLLGGGAAAAFGLVIGIPVLRLKGDYLAITTLAFGEIVRSICENLKITNGAGGLVINNYYTNYKHFTYAFVIMIITILVISNLIRSKQGRAICAIRENTIAAESIGVNVSKMKVFAFMLSAFFAGLAGVLHAHNQGSIFPVEAGYNHSIDILVIVVLGGMGSIKGSVIAAVILTILPEILRDAADLRKLIYAVALIAMMLMSSNEKVAAFRNRIVEKLPKFHRLQKEGK